MIKRVGLAAFGGGALAALALVLTPALAATTQQQRQQVKRVRVAPSFGAGSFTPAVSDPRLAAEFARRGLQPGNLRFTPSPAAGSTDKKSKAVRVAVRARALTPAQASRVSAETSASPVTAITPAAYNLGLSVGWKRFALSGDVARVSGGSVPGSREAAEVGLSYSGNKFTGRVAVGADRADGTQLKLVEIESSYSLDVGGSYSLTRNLDLTGGVRYKIQNDRLEPLEDERRDSQAVYLGTAFRF